MKNLFLGFILLGAICLTSCQFNERYLKKDIWYVKKKDLLWMGAFEQYFQCERVGRTKKVRCVRIKSSEIPKDAKPL